MKRSREKLEVVLVFGEDAHDRDAIAHLVRAIRPAAPTMKARRTPLFLIRGVADVASRGAARKLASVVAADAVDHDVRGVLVHEDCDDFEPAHIALAARKARMLAAEGVPNPVAVTPAWETEAWWFLWPDAVKAAFPSWRLPDDHVGKDVGRLKDAKEAFRRATRSGEGKRGYTESDSVRIAEQVAKSGIIDAPQAISASFTAFRAAVRAAPW